MLGLTISAMTLSKYARYIENKDKKEGFRDGIDTTIY